MENLKLVDEGSDLPASELLRREVFKKTTKGKTSIRKVLLWKTNKGEISKDFPRFIVHWTDYSPDRKDPIKRVVRPASSEKNAALIAKKMLSDNIKKGWEKVEN